jgi:Tfp pilus assembly protein PilF
MSLILDALRKGSRAGRAAPAADAAHADSVLATLGYGPMPPARAVGSRAIAPLGMVMAVALAAWWFWPMVSPPNSSSPTRVTQAVGPVSVPRAVPWTPERRPAAATAPTPVPVVSMRDEFPTEVDVRPALSHRRSHGDEGAGVTRASASDFRLAIYYHRAGDFDRAQSHYRAVLARYELNPEAHNNLGLLYQQKGLLDESVHEFQRATFINPRYGRAHCNLGVTLMRQGKLDLARAEFELAASLDPRDTDARVNLALVQSANREPEAARATLLNALAIDPSSAAAHYNLGLLYDQVGETSRALEHYRAFLGNAGMEHASLAASVNARVEELSRAR